MYNVAEYGVTGDGKTNNTRAIEGLIAKMAANGGGMLYFPAGEYVTGTIELKDNMTLFLESGAVILGSESPEDYPMITSETLEGYNRGGHSGLIKAFGAKNVSVCGRGTIDGRGQSWWSHPENEHRPRVIQMILCENVLIDGVTIINSPMWTVHPICCNNVKISNISIKNPYNSPNTDGINPESCSGVHITNCTIDVGDDCLTLKSGTETDLFQKQHPCENIVVSNCVMRNGHGGVVIGSEMSGGVKNVTITNCIFDGTDRGIRIKTRRKRGGIVEDVIFSNIIMRNTLVPLVINGYYACGADVDPEDMNVFGLGKVSLGDGTPIIRNISISNIRATGTLGAAAYIWGIPECPVDGLNVSGYAVEMAESCEEVTEKPIMAIHVKPVTREGIFCANIANSVLDNITVKNHKGKTLRLANCENVRVGGIENEEDCVCTDCVGVTLCK